MRLSPPSINRREKVKGEGTAGIKEVSESTETAISRRGNEPLKRRGEK